MFTAARAVKREVNGEPVEDLGTRKGSTSSSQRYISQSREKIVKDGSLVGDKGLQ